MTREIWTYPISREEIWEELRHFVNYFISVCYLDCAVSLGFSWVTDYYDGETPKEERIALAKLETKVRHLELADFGRLGSDELYVDIAGITFRFCDECDLHMYFDNHTLHVEHFESRWRAMGFQPSKHQKSE
jgi:hypothetical protein